MRTISKYRGAALITVLLVFSLLLVVGLSLLTRARYSGVLSAQQTELAQARNLAFSGLEDFRQKCGHDPDFPPRPEEGEEFLGYSESLPGAGMMSGGYTVSYSLRWVDSHRILAVTSTGLVNSSQFVVTAYLDLSPGLRWLGMHHGHIPEVPEYTPPPSPFPGF